VAPFLPGDLLARRSSIVIGNGGSPGLYQALAEGRPVLGIPQNLDQHMSMAAIGHLGATLSLRSDRLSASAVRRAVERLVGEPGFRQAAGVAADLIRAHPTSVWFPRYVEAAIG
jgi:UDP:flavonoid glycosyltransferase YjiC (YdhE family)